ncbi:VOC family protein [Pseudomonas aeruginosa]|uniref:VOC family protein n=1 Tax=Pseudomonas aeruginosa TaxID=287 RepID=UPI003D2E56E5
MLFYKSLFDFGADDEVVLPDPYGLVTSRAVRSPCGSVRLPLNISEDRNTAIARSLSSYRGSGVHHIAFDCADIFAAVAQAKEAGVALLEIPLNYYDDLARASTSTTSSSANWPTTTSSTTATPRAASCSMCSPSRSRSASSSRSSSAATATPATARPTCRCAWRRWRKRGGVCAGSSCENCRGSGRCSSYSRAGPA